ASETSFRMEELENVAFRTVDVALQPYGRPEPPQVIAETTREGRIIDETRAPAVAAAAAAASAVVQESIASRPTQGFVGAAGGGAHYAGDLFSEVERYARLAAYIAMREQFDVVHAHDWMTYPAGIAAAAVSGKPLVVHVHSTEFDRSGENVNRRIYAIERQGVHAAARVIAVSLLTKNILIQ